MKNIYNKDMNYHYINMAISLVKYKTREFYAIK